MSDNRFEALTFAIARFSKLESMSSLCHAVVDETIHHLGFDRCGIFLNDPTTDTKLGMWGTAPDGELVDERGTRAIISDRERHSTFGGGTVKVIENTQLYHQDQKIGFGDLIECIVLDQGQVLGWLFIDNFISNRQVSSEDESFVELFGSIVGQLIVRQRHHEVLQERNERLQAAMQDLKKAQQSLVQSARLASLSNVVVGMAHELNTPLGTAITAASLIEHQVSDIVVDNSASDIIDKEAFNETNDLLMSNLRRAASLVQEFKSLSRTAVSESCEDVDVQSFIHSRFNALEHELGNGRECLLHLEQFDNGLVQIPVQAFQRIIDELFINIFRHAYKNNPVEIWVGLRRLPEDAFSLTIEDAGCGLPDDTHDYLFDPFYTGNRQHGPGLGASVAHNLVLSQLRGSIEAFTSERGGLGIRLFIPNICQDPE